MTDDPWYKKGLRFKCTECGACCTGSPGYVWLEEHDVEAICSTLQISREEFFRKYTRRVGGRYALKEHVKTYDCVFFKDNRCTVYTARPRQCRTFPWWIEHLTTKDAWKQAAKRCEGIDLPDGKLHTIDEIHDQIM